MTRSERIYRALLLAYPERTRLIYGEDMVQLFRDRMRDAGSSLERATVWFEAITDVAVTAPREHLARRRVAKVVEGPEADASRPLGPDLAAASLPLVVAVLLLVALPGYYRPLFDNRVSIIGLPAGSAMLTLTTLLAAFGIFEGRRGDMRELGPRILVLTVLLSPLALLLVQLPFFWVYLVEIVLFAAIYRHQAPSIVLAGVLMPLLAFVVFSGGAPFLLVYAVLVTLLMLAARVRWLLYALVIPFVAVLLFGPALILTMINLKV